MDKTVIAGNSIMSLLTIGIFIILVFLFWFFTAPDGGDIPPPYIRFIQFVISIKDYFLVLFYDRNYCANSDDDDSDDDENGDKDSDKDDNDDRNGGNDGNGSNDSDDDEITEKDIMSTSSRMLSEKKSVLFNLEHAEKGQNEPCSNGSTAFICGKTQRTDGSAIFLTYDEVQTIVQLRMYRETLIRQGVDVSRAKTRVLQSVGIKRGASKQYQRISYLYDTFFGQQSNTPYYRPLINGIPAELALLQRKESENNDQEKQKMAD